MVLDRALILANQQTRLVRYRSLLPVMVVGLVVVWFGSVRLEPMLRSHSFNVNCCRDLNWDGTEFIHWLNTHELAGEVWTNDADRASLYAGLYLKPLPANLREAWYERWVADLPPESYLVWFLRNAPVHYTPDDLTSLVDLEPVQQYDNGIVFRMTPHE